MLSFYVTEGARQLKIKENRKVVTGCTGAIWQVLKSLSELCVSPSFIVAFQRVQTDMICLTQDLLTWVLSKVSSHAANTVNNNAA